MNRINAILDGINDRINPTSIDNIISQYHIVEGMQLVY
jgi:hypothetical protein